MQARTAATAMGESTRRRHLSAGVAAFLGTNENCRAPKNSLVDTAVTEDASRLSVILKYTGELTDLDTFELLAEKRG
jgi:hypothetical protein